jgi:predicted dinucleotide-binding enzyme
VFALAEDMGFHPVDVGTLMVRRLTGPRHLDAATVAEMAQPPSRTLSGLRLAGGV